MTKTVSTSVPADAQNQLLVAVLASMYAQNSKPNFKAIARFLGVTYDTAEGRLRQPRKAANTMVKEAGKGRFPAMESPRKQRSVNKVCKAEKRVGMKSRVKAKPALKNSSQGELEQWENLLDCGATVSPAQMQL